MLNLQQKLFSFVDLLSRRQKRLVLLSVDGALSAFALYATCAIVYNSIFPRLALWQLWLCFAIIPPFVMVFAASIGMHRIQLKAYESAGIFRTGLMVLASTLVFGALHSLLDLPMPGAGIFLFGLLFFLLSTGTRFVLLHVLIWALRLGHSRVRVLIYGAGTTGTQLAAALRSHESIEPVAFVDDNAALHKMTVSGLRVYNPAKLETIVRERGIDRVLLAMPSVSAPKLAQIARRLQAKGLDVHTLPSFAQLIGTEALIDTLTPVAPGKFLGRHQMDTALPLGSSAYADKCVLVSGAGGSVGSELCRQLLQHRPRRIVLFEVSEIALYTVDRELQSLADGTGVEIVAVLGTVTDARMARSAMIEHAIEVVFHAAAYKHVPLVEANPIAGVANNVLGTRVLADAAHDAGVGRFILISTDKAVRPTNIMGASKRFAEMVVQDMAKRSASTVFSLVRFGNVLGSSGSVIPLFKEQIAKGGPVTLTHEDVTRYFMTIHEAVRLVLLAGSLSDLDESSRGGDVFVLDMGKPVKIRDLATQMIEAAGYSVRSDENPDGDIEIQVIGLRPGEKLHEELLIGKGLLTTPHPKILRASERGLSEIEMASALRKLRSAVASGDSSAARTALIEHVEGYQAPSVANVVPENHARQS